MARFSKAPVVLHVHTPVAMAGFLARGSRVARRLKQRVVGGARMIIVPSARGMAPLAETTRTQIRVVANSVHPGQFESWPLDRREKRFVYLGWLTKDKGVFDLVTAFKRVAAADAQAALVLSGPFGASGLRAHISHHHLDDRIDVRDWTAGEDKKRLLASSRALVLPSYSEGFPVVLVEAMFSGLPIIATDVGGVADAVEDGGNGFLVQPGDIDSLAARMTELLRDDVLFSRQSAESLARSSDYDAAKASRELLQVWALARA